MNPMTAMMAVQAAPQLKQMFDSTPGGKLTNAIGDGIASLVGGLFESGAAKQEKQVQMLNSL